MKTKEAGLVPIARFVDVYAGRSCVRTPFVVEGPSMTKQSFKDEADINVIMRRYEASGILPGSERMADARYMDVTGADFEAAMIVVASAKTAFAEMPAKLRDRFGNDPAELLAFLENPKNLEEARELGLVERAARVATPLAVRVVEPTTVDPGKAMTRIESGEQVRPGPDAKPLSGA